MLTMQHFVVNTTRHAVRLQTRILVVWMGAAHLGIVDAAPATPDDDLG